MCATVESNKLTLKIFSASLLDSLQYAYSILQLLHERQGGRLWQVGRREPEHEGWQACARRVHQDVQRKLFTLALNVNVTIGSVTISFLHAFGGLL